MKSNKRSKIIKTTTKKRQKAIKNAIKKILHSLFPFWCNFDVDTCQILLKGQMNFQMCFLSFYCIKCVTNSITNVHLVNAL